jgi:hypothetical protein
LRLRAASRPRAARAGSGSDDRIDPTLERKRESRNVVIFSDGAWTGGRSSIGQVDDAIARHRPQDADGAPFPATSESTGTRIAQESPGTAKP